MSESKPKLPVFEETPEGDTPRPNRTSNSRPKKTAKRPKSEKDAGTKSDQPSPPVVDFGEGPAEAAKPADAPSHEGSKRKRRRKKGKGGGTANAASSLDASSEPAGQAAGAEATATPRPAQQPRPKLDTEAVAKLAWKIYLAEVSEEGVALIGDSDAKELSRRCFRLAEIFMEEQVRRG